MAQKIVKYILQKQLTCRWNIPTFYGFVRKLSDLPARWFFLKKSSGSGFLSFFGGQD
jgi:hypothetical protein